MQTLSVPRPASTSSNFHAENSTCLDCPRQILTLNVAGAPLLTHHVLQIISCVRCVQLTVYR